MSIQVQRGVWESSRAERSALLVLVAIADYANNDGVAWPSVKTLARKVRLSERETQRLTARLVEMGELKIVRGLGTGKRNRYVVVCGMGEGETAKHTKDTNGGWGRGDGETEANGEVGRVKGDAGDRTSRARGDGGDGTPGVDRVSGVTIRVTELAGKGDGTGALYKEVEPSSNHQYMNRQIDSAREREDRHSCLVVPLELAAFDGELRGCPGYDPDERFYEMVLEKYSGLDLEEQGIMISGWFTEPANRKRLCTRGFVLGWLRRESGESGSGNRMHRMGRMDRMGAEGRERDLDEATGLEIFD